MIFDLYYVIMFYVDKMSAPIVNKDRGRHYCVDEDFYNTNLRGL